MVKRILLLLLGSLFTAGAAEVALPVAEKTPLVQIGVDQDGREIADSYIVTVNVFNTLEKPIRLKSLELYLPPALLARIPDDEEKALLARDLGEKTLLPAQKLSYRFNIVRGNTSKADFTFRARGVKIVAGLAYTFEHPDEPDRFVEASTEMACTGTLMGKIVGGILGSLIVALFLVVRSNEGGNKSRSPKEVIKGIARQLVMGVTATMGVIFFLHCMQDATLPINIRVEDAYGGMLVGFLSIPLGEWLSKVVKGQAKPK